MIVKVGMACGTCSACGRRICRPRPASIALCDCHEYCPICWARVLSYKPDLTASTYESGEISIVAQCPKCGYESTQKPVEVILS